MDRRKIEQITASIAVSLLCFITVGMILFIANATFNWDIFPPEIEKVLGFILISCVGIIFSSVFVNVMLNFSIIAINTDVIATHLISGKKKGKSDES
jgi:drug/metabolite transporter (DMT)-like permease